MSKISSFAKTEAAQDTARKIATWYRQNRRPLPWRTSQDPYQIWISEVMLQQTTVAAVVPYYQRFLNRFPTLQSLATAPLDDVLEMWAGLGYYSRARNLHKSAIAISQLPNGFPRSAEELLALPGFGPYTSRAVASLAYDEPVGVLDGNVIRILSRYYGLKVQWWKPQGRQELQSLADQLALSGETPSDLNQALMELGATVCTPTNPACAICPWLKSCVAVKAKSQNSLPLKKPRREREIWVWKIQVPRKKNHVGLVENLENQFAPFLKGHLIWPGQAKRTSIAPKKFAYKGTVTHHDIFVQINSDSKTKQALPPKKMVWVKASELNKKVPASLVRKAVTLTMKSLILLAMLTTLMTACTTSSKSKDNSMSSQQTSTAMPDSGPGNSEGSPGTTVAVTPSSLQSIDVGFGRQAQKVTRSGENSESKFSPSGNYLLYLSRRRLEHAQVQAYEMNLQTFKERRLTFQDGDVANPSYIGNGERILYASSTDEIKEVRNFIPELRKRYGGETSGISNSASGKIQFSNTELYLASIDGLMMKRLTHSPGYDAEAAADPQARKIALTSVRSGKPDLFILNIDGAQQTQLTNDSYYESRPQFSPNGRDLIWTQYANNQNSAEIFLLQNLSSGGSSPKAGRATLSSTNLIYHQAAWSPSGREIVLSSNRGTGTNAKTNGTYLQIFVLQFDSELKPTCLWAITDSPGDKQFPAFSPDGSKIAFTQTLGETSQIYMMNTPKQNESTPCLTP